MIRIEEIIPDDILKVLVDHEGVQDELFARVLGVGDAYVYVQYLVDTSKVYKGAEVYELEQDENAVERESICEHYPQGTTFENVGFYKISENVYAIYDDIDSEDSNSEIEDLSDSESEADSFIVEDDGCADLPPDASDVDNAWNEWKPSSPGMKRYKETIDLIEYHVKRHADNINF